MAFSEEKRQNLLHEFFFGKNRKNVFSVPDGLHKKTMSVFEFPKLIFSLRPNPHTRKYKVEKIAYCIPIIHIVSSLFHM